MNNSVSIKDNIYLIGVNDRRTQLFENLWPLPAGVSYNSYLITDEKNALLDTVECGMESNYVERVEEMLGDRPLDYLIINHMEPDHSGEIEAVLLRWPSVRIVGNGQTRKILLNYYSFREENFHEVKDGDSISLGSHTLRFVLTPWVHWPETMMTYETKTRTLFSADAFGTFGAFGNAFADASRICDYEDEMRRYYSNIVGKYNGMVQKALPKLADTPIDTICPLHGPVWQGEVSKLVELYDKWSKGEGDDAAVIIYGSMYNNTAHMADHIASGIIAAGVNDVKIYDASKTHLSYLISEIWRCRYVVLSSCAYNGGMLPTMDQLCSTMAHIGLDNRSLALFGGYSWSGGGVRALKAFAETIGWKQICEPVEVAGRATPEKMTALDPLAAAVAEEIIKRSPSK